MTETSQSIPRDTTRFARLLPDPVATMPEGRTSQLGYRSSLQTAIEGPNTPDWIQPVKPEGNQSI